MAIAGLVIVGVVLVAPRAREAANLFAAPTAEVTTTNSSSLPGVVLQPAPAGEAPAAPAATTADPADGTADPAAGGDASASATGSAGVSVGGAHAGVSGTANGSTSGVNGGVQGGASAGPASAGAAVGGSVGQTIFSDTFEGSPLTKALPTGWLLGDTVQSVTAPLGGVPIVGTVTGLLLGGGGQSTGSLLPTTVLDGSHVLARSNGTWSHLSAGTPWVAGSATADIKPLSGTGFVGVAGRFLNASNFMSCGIRDGKSLELWQVVNGTSQLLASKPMAIVANVFHTVQMQMEGVSVSCSMDGVTVLNTTGATLTASGKIGLIALGSLAAEFDNVRAIALPQQ